MKIVNAEEKHIPAIRDIYAHHVLHGALLQIVGGDKLIIPFC